MENLQNIIKAYVEKHFHVHLHLSLRYISGAVMIILSLGFGIFMVDSSIFSANLVQNQILSDATSFSESSVKYAGVLPESPLYSIVSFVNHYKNTGPVQVFVIFTKLIKASEEQSSSESLLAQEFSEQIKKLSSADQSQLIKKLTPEIADISVESNAFSYVFDIYAVTGNEKLWTEKLVSYINQSGNSSIINARAQLVFSKLAVKNNWESYIINKDLVSDLSFIKQSVENPVRDGEIMHASPEKWMEGNAVWKAL